MSMYNIHIFVCVCIHCIVLCFCVQKEYIPTFLPTYIHTHIHVHIEAWHVCVCVSLGSPRVLTGLGVRMSTSKQSCSWLRG